MRGNKFATDVIHHAVVITNRWPESSLRWLKYMNAERLGGGKRKRRERRKKRRGEGGRWEGMKIDTIYHQRSECQALCHAPYQIYLI